MTDEERYFAALHAMQTGVAIEMGIDERASATEPKHLRVGVNSAMVNMAALARLLMDKGIITPEEYTKANADEMEAEHKRYEERLGVTLL